MYRGRATAPLSRPIASRSAVLRTAGRNGRLRHELKQGNPQQHGSAYRGGAH
jgi:hypothetical protein